jgi:hypothetical protein
VGQQQADNASALRCSLRRHVRIRQRARTFSSVALTPPIAARAHYHGIGLAFTLCAPPPDPSRRGSAETLQADLHDHRAACLQGKTIHPRHVLPRHGWIYHTRAPATPVPCRSRTSRRLGRDGFDRMARNNEYRRRVVWSERVCDPEGSAVVIGAVSHGSAPITPCRAPPSIEISSIFIFQIGCAKLAVDG